DELLEQLQRHELGQPALVQAQVRARHDDRAARVVHALAQQLPAEAALLALEPVAQGLQPPAAPAGDGAPAAVEPEQRIDGLLLALAGLDLLLEVLGLGVEVDLLAQVADRLGAHAATEVLAEAVRGPEALLELAEQRLVVLDALGLHVLEQVPDLAHALGG